MGAESQWDQKVGESDWGCGSVGRVLVISHTVLDFIPVLHKLGMVEHACNTRTQEVKAGTAEIQDHLQLYSEIDTSLGYMRPDLIIINTTTIDDDDDGDLFTT